MLLNTNISGKIVSLASLYKLYTSAFNWQYLIPTHISTWEGLRNKFLGFQLVQLADKMVLEGANLLNLRRLLQL